MRLGFKRGEKKTEPETSEAKPAAKKSSDITLTVLGGKARTFAYVDGMTVQKLLDQAKITLDEGQVVAVGGHKAGLTTVLKAGASVTITSAIKNG